MKNLIIFSFLLILSLKGTAQHQNIPATLSHLVAPLNKSDIPSGFLWDKGINGLAEPAVYDGHLYDSAFLQPTEFGFLYAQIRNSNVTGGVI